MTLLGISITPHDMELLRDAVLHPYCSIAPLVAGALISGGASLLGNIFGGASANKANRESMKFQEHMYDRQRADALADWNMQNEYNSPIQQMARLKAGGLNPALFYGGGTTGITSAQTVRSSSPGSYRAESFRPDMSGIINAAMNLTMMKKQAANLDAQNDLIHAQAEETRSRIPKNQAETAGTNFDTAMKERLADINTAIKQQEYEKLFNDTQHVVQTMDLEKQRNLREIAAQKVDISKKVAETVKVIAETKNVELTHEEIQAKIDSLNLKNRLDAMEVEWKRQGFTSHDNVIFRAILGVSEAIFKGIANFIK